MLLLRGLAWLGGLRSLVGSLNKIPLSLLGIVMFNAPTSLANVSSILFGETPTDAFWSGTKRVLLACVKLCLERDTFSSVRRS